MPDDLDSRRQREADKAEICRLTDTIAEQANTKLPRSPIRAAMNQFLDVVSTGCAGAGTQDLVALHDAANCHASAENEEPVW